MCKLTSAKMNLPEVFQNKFIIRAESSLSDSKAVFFILSILAFVVFWPALQGDFVGDDVLRILEHEPLLAGDLANLLTYYNTDRPIVMLTIWLNYLIGGVNPFIYKLTNLIFHLLCAQAGFLLLRRLFRNLPFKNVTAFLATAIFLVHPLNHHVVQAAVQRSVAMAGFFLILSFISFVKFYEFRARRDFLLSLFLFLLAVLSKPVAVALPAVLIIYLLMVRARFLDITKWVSIFFVFWLIPIWNYTVAPEAGGGPTDFKFENWRYFLIQTKVFFIYLQKFFLPFPMEFIHSIHNSADKIYSENFIPYLLIYSVIFISLGVWFLLKRSLPSALLLMAYAVYLPQSSFYSILHVLFYHRMYLSVFFSGGALAYLILRSPFFRGKIAIPVSLVGLAIIYFSVCSYGYFSQVKSYSDWLWYNIQANPGNLNFNVSTLFMLKRRNYSPEEIKKFAAYISDRNSGKEIAFAQVIALYSPENPDAKKTVQDVAAFLSTEQTSNSFFHGAMLFLETEAPRFFQAEQAVLSLNSIYFSRLNSTVLLGDTILNSVAKRNFISVLQIQNRPSGLEKEKLEFFKLRSRIVLLIFFKVNTGLNLAEALSSLQTNYSALPESKWLTEKIQKIK